MDKLIMKKLLEEKFDDEFVFLPGFYDDFEELTKNSGNAERITQLLLTKLYAILELGDCDCGLKWLERLKHCDNLYSLHLKTKNENYRLLLSKGDDGKIFLHMFFEKSGKGNTSYSDHIPIAIKRRENYLKGL